MTASAPVRYERSDSASILTIDRPERRNAVDGETAELLRRGLRRFEDDEEARVLVLTGNDVAFCAGADLKSLETLEPGHPDGPMGFTRVTPTKPTIAAVSGWCLAGGLEIALWCDLRIAAEGSTFGLFERRWGVPLIDGGTQRLPRLVGPAKALEMNATGEPISASEAYEYGLVNRVLPDHELFDAALSWARKFARQAPVALERIKQVSHAGDLDAGIEAEKGAFIEAFTSEDAREGISAFLEKRTPRFRGR
jgi:enoyl-CoA hydratase